MPQPTTLCRPYRLLRPTSQSAFGLLADPAALDDACVNALTACRNLVVMPLLQTPELTAEACRAARRLKAQKCSML